MWPPNATELARFIEHTDVRPNARAADIVRLCEEADRYRCHAVCVLPDWVYLAAYLLRGKPSVVVALLDFPEGKSTTAVRIADAQAAIKDGATELDVVCPSDWFLARRSEEMLDDLRAIREEIPESIALKAVVETAGLTLDQQARAARLVAECGVGWLHIATGAHQVVESTVQVVRHLAWATGGHIRLKVNGRIGTLQQALALLDAGASRLGTSATVAILDELRGS